MKPIRKVKELNSEMQQALLEHLPEHGVKLNLPYLEKLVVHIINDLNTDLSNRLFESNKHRIWDKVISKTIETSLIKHYPSMSDVPKQLKEEIEEISKVFSSDYFLDEEQTRYALANNINVNE